MPMHRLSRWALLCCGLACTGAEGQTEPARPVPVRLEKGSGGFQLLRGGQPYHVRGGGGDGSMELLARLGGNSVRTWGVDEGLGKRLDEARKLGLTVCVGLWLGHERHGFNYGDPAQLARQEEEVRAAVLKYKDHPAVLLWGIGNEMEGDGENSTIWREVDRLAAMVKQLDPNHPTMTVIAEPVGPKTPTLHRLCPNIDLVGINSYGGAATVADRYRKAGGTKPFLLTEFGPAGRWEIEATAWGAPPEPTSTAKAAAYRRAYQASVKGAPGLCLGSYAFIWGHKQEATATWFGILLPDGRRLAAADKLSELWTGKPVANLCPEIRGLELAGPDQLDPGAVARFKLSAVDPEGDPLAVRWVVRREVTAYSSGGDQEAAAPEFASTLVSSGLDAAEVRLPDSPGGYRVFAYVNDGQGGAATANIPLFVSGEKPLGAAPRATVPLVVYDEAGRSPLPFAPTGWMGNQAALKLDGACTDRPRSGKTCLRLTYSAPDQWAGIVWQDPPNDWGDVPGGHDLTGAKSLTFWARGGTGAETIAVEFGLLGPDKPHPDTAGEKLANLRLSKDWKRYEIALAGKNLARIKSGFVVVLTGSGRPQTIDLDDIRYE